MDRKNFRKISCAEARDYDMVEYLSGIGIKPAKIRGHNFWYISPLRSEKTPSFKVNRKMNRWFDFGDGAGGNLIDFAIRYYNCSVADFLQMLSGGEQLFHRPENFIDATPAETIEVISEQPLRSVALLEYVRNRRIPFAIAQKYCCEVYYHFAKRNYYAIGFKNDSAGYELRSACFKGSSIPKDITTIQNGAQELSVFEGFFNFLSYLAIIGHEATMDFLILNSTSLFQRGLSIMEQYAKVHLYLDHDSSGRKCIEKALSMSERYIDESHLYEGYNDLNGFLVHLMKMK